MSDKLTDFVFEVLEQNGEQSHEELTYRIDASSEEIHEAITQLRSEDRVESTLGRKYRVIE